MNEIERLCDCTPYLYILRAVEGLVLHTPLRLGRVVVIVFTVISSPFPENHFKVRGKLVIQHLIFQKLTLQFHASHELGVSSRKASVTSALTD